MSGDWAAAGAAGNPEHFRDQNALVGSEIMMQRLRWRRWMVAAVMTACPAAQGKITLKQVKAEGSQQGATTQPAMKAELQDIRRIQFVSMERGEIDELTFGYKINRPSNGPTISTIVFVPDRITTDDGTKLTVEKDRSFNWAVYTGDMGFSIRLHLPAHPPKKITELRGKAIVKVPTAFEILTATELSDQHSQQATIEGVHVKINPIEPFGDRKWKFSVVADRGDLPRDEWLEFRDKLSAALPQARLTAKGGHFFEGGGIGGHGTPEFMEYEMGYHLASDMKGGARGKDVPDTLTIKWPAKIRTVEVPVEIRDVPIP